MAAKTEDAKYLSPAQVCELLPGVTEEILLKRRNQRLDPPFHKPTGQYGNVVLYERAAVLAWVGSSLVVTRAGEVA